MKINFNPHKIRKPHPHFQNQQVQQGKIFQTKEEELDRLKQAMLGLIDSDSQQVAASGEDEAQDTNIQQGPPAPPDVVLQFMNKLGVQPTGSKEGDLAVMTAKIDSLEASAKTPSEKANVQSLRSELSSVLKAGDSVGANQLAALNKFFMLKK